jgi:Ca-dependent carbohydrate-binding module xylan-binding
MRILAKDLKIVRQYFIGIALFLCAFNANAAFTFPGTLPAGCTNNGGGSYTCGALTLNDHVIFNDTGDVTITVNGSLTINNYTIGSNTDAANTTFVVNGNVTINSPTIHANISAGIYNITYNGVASTSGSLTTTTGNISTRGVVYGNITTNSGQITVNANNTSVIWGEITVKDATTTNYTRIYQDAVINGSIYSNSTSATANLHVNIEERATVNGSIIVLGRDYSYVNLNFDAVVNGNITVFGNDASQVSLNNRSRVNGHVKSTSVDNDDGDVDLNTSAVITGDVTAFGDINNYGAINGCAHSTYTSGTNISLRSGSTNTGGSCCGSNRTSCGLSCVSNASGTATKQCQAVEAIIVNAYGQPLNNVWPIMELWVNQVRVGTVIVNSVTAQNYTFYANLPTTGEYTLDLVFPNDAYNPPLEDRNLFINSITYQSTTILSTDARVTRDYGSNSTEYFDGINTAGPGADLFSNGAMRFDTSIPATLIAEYALDEASWNGTLNEAKDKAGYTGGPFDGQGVGTTKPTAMNSSPARVAGSAGTCGYATFSGNALQSSFTLDGLPVSTAVGAKTTVSFWMYWDGNANYSTPIGWNLYALAIGNGVFGFDTFNADRYGINSSALQVGWRHIVAVFNNGNVSQSQLYIDGVKQTISQVRGTPNNSSAYVQSTLNLARITNTGVNNLGFSGGRIDEVKVYNGAMTQAQVTADYNATHACPVYNIVPSSFNCVVVGGDSNTGRLYTQLAGTSFNIDVVALNASRAAETAYVTSGTKDVTVEFVDGTGTTACGSRLALSPAVSQTVTFAAADAGRKTVSNITISKAYRDLACRVTDANQSPSVVGCSSDDFAVRPSSISISSSANADAAGTSATASPIVKSGATFSLTASTGIAGYDGTPLIDATKLNAHSGAVQLGVLSGGFSAANAATGNASDSTFNYSEVGYFRFAANGVYDSTFTAVDSAVGDCATGFVTSGGKYGCSFGNTAATNYFGRFIPDHFALTVGANTEGCDSGNFTYYGQDGLSTAFTLTAQNASNQTTQNYTGSFAKLGLTNWSNYNFISQGSPYSPELSASATLPTGTWTSGSASVTAKHQITRLSAMVPQSPKCADEWGTCTFSGTRTVIYGANGIYTSGSFTNSVSCTNGVFGDPIFGTIKACYLGNLPSPSTVSIFAKPTDSDGVTIPLTAVTAASTFRFGRLFMPNTYGSELLPLTVPIEAQYWNGTSYQRNQLDVCSVIPTSAIAMGNYKSNLAACETALTGGGTMSAGKTGVKLSAPGAGNNGSVDLSINLNSAIGNTCNSATQTSATSASLPWFGNTNPSARETFGLFKTPVIYMRENF